MCKRLRENSFDAKKQLFAPDTVIGSSYFDILYYVCFCVVLLFIDNNSHYYGDRCAPSREWVIRGAVSAVINLFTWQLVWCHSVKTIIGKLFTVCHFYVHGELLLGLELKCEANVFSQRFPEKFRECVIVILLLVDV